MANLLKKNILLLFPLLLICFACNHDKKKEKKSIDAKTVKESFIRANKNIIKTEEQEIDDFLKRYGWTMRETGSGLRYKIIEEGSGEKAAKGKTATIDYSVQFLSGDTLEKSPEQKPKSFLIGKDDVVAGLHEGILLLKEGDEAIFIIPSHLAYGFTGKPGSIPPKATLVYHVKLLEIK
ncbi:MAG: FKBP-type peptidyl-prolyl cis-trans isomerase [Bacteroidales bacterium]|nr:FKBP-type peptidyl-prolyl cis-trans isomerase [Bacteroidales bacterium]MCF8399021.1 FKBP-type peptidyl-prolyl cis-trans isomerase [Bacteroidales bacterium]